MQAALPCFLMGNGPGTMALRGGTNADMAPPVDYTVMVCHFEKLLSPVKEYEVNLLNQGFTLN
ncbi:hypothetical protein DPMN_082760 [Dreissena polymorpha]|uniref:RNA 3'-terminal phosphate cyclase domain-containing protein n=1 Tax=Dreissena polymorpha TaxID=45954 RepID=A0A9D4BJ54_DREPO|nr:hypothetical protein DPMN_082760 [Dreissena polymorpha]